MDRRSRLKMDPSKTPETDLSGFQEQGGYIDQETIDELKKFDKEKKLDRRTISNRKKKEYQKNKERLKNLPGDDDISEQGRSKGNPTVEENKPLTEEEIEANRKGIEEAKKKMRGGPLDKDGFLDFSTREALKIGMQAAQTARMIHRYKTLPYRAVGGVVKALTIGNLGGNI